jgi:acyl carrier protein
VEVRHVANARTMQEVVALSLLDDSTGPATAAALRETIGDVGAGAALDPEDVWALADHVPYAVTLDWSAGRRDGSFDVLLTRAESGAVVVPSRRSDGGARPWTEYANTPLRGRLARSLIPHLQQFLHDRLPTFMIPSTFVLLDALPLTPNGKVDRRALPEPDHDRPALDTRYVAPRTPAEDSLVAIWSELLRLERVGIHDDFFSELGGHSLIATQVVSRIRAVFDVGLPLRAIFEQPTIAGLAALIAQRQGQGDRSDAPIERIVSGAADRSTVDVDQLSPEQVDALLRELLEQEGSTS